MSADHAHAELRLHHDLGRLLGDDREPIDDHALLDPAYRDYLVRAADAISADFVELAAQLHDRMRHPPFYVIVRGLTFDVGNVVLSTIASTLGQPVQPYPDPSFTVLRELRPGSSSHSPQWGVLTEWLHTDSTNWGQPHDITLMLCRRPDQNGQGVSLVLPLDQALRAVEAALGTSAIQRLRDTALPWAIDVGMGGGVTWEPALTARGIRWQLFRVAEAMGRDNAECEPDSMDFLTAVDKAMRESRDVDRFALEAGDLLIMNNHQALHARGPIANAGASERVLVHCKVNEHVPHLPATTYSDGLGVHYGR